MTPCASTVAVGWSSYFQKLLALLFRGYHLPTAIRTAPFNDDPETGEFLLTGGWLNLPAVVITAILVWGIKESVRFNSTMVLFELIVVAFVIIVGAFYVDPANGKPVAPKGYTGVSFFGKTVLGSSDAGGKPVGVFAGAAFLPLPDLAELVNIGFLMAFVIVCAAVLIMRRTNPPAERPLRAPMIPRTPILGIATCLLLMFSLPGENWLRLFLWLAIGLVIYFLYGRHHSILARGPG